MDADAYIRRATLVRRIDGDTYVLDIDLGYHAHVQVPCRLRGVDCPELSTPEGRTTAAIVEIWLQAAPFLTVTSYKDHQSFARWIVDIKLGGVEDLATKILADPTLVKKKA